MSRVCSVLWGGSQNGSNELKISWCFGAKIIKNLGCFYVLPCQYRRERNDYRKQCSGDKETCKNVKYEAIIGRRGPWDHFKMAGVTSNAAVNGINFAVGTKLEAMDYMLQWWVIKTYVIAEESAAESFFVVIMNFEYTFIERTHLIIRTHIRKI